MVVKYIYFHQLYISSVLSSDLILKEIKGYYPQGFPGGAMVENPPANVGDAGDSGLIPGLGRSPGVSDGNPLQYSCRENSADRGAWTTTVRGVAESQTRLTPACMRYGQERRGTE